MTKKIYAIMMKKMVKVKKKRVIFAKPCGVFQTLHRVFSQHFNIGGKNPAGFYKKNKYQKFVKK